MKTVRVVCLGILCGLLGADCSKQTLIRKYYVLEPPAIIQPSDSLWVRRIASKIDVRDFQVARAFEQTRIALRSGSHELDYYFYHHWAVRPSVGMADMVYELMERSRSFSRLTRNEFGNPDYFVSGEVFQLERVEMKKKTGAHLHAVFTLTDFKTRMATVRHEFNRTVEMKKDQGMNRFADTISELLQEETLSFLAKIANTLAPLPVPEVPTL